MRKLWFLAMVLCLLAGSVLLVSEAVADEATVTIPVYNIKGVQVQYDIGSGTTSLHTDKVNLRYSYQAAYLQFDLSSIFDLYGQENLVSASVKWYGENGTGRDFWMAALKDGVNESWTETNLTWETAPGEPNATSFALDAPEDIYDGDAFWMVNQDTSGVDAILTDLGTAAQDPDITGLNCDQAASYQSVDSTYSGHKAANTILKAFLQTDTDGLVTLIAYHGTNNQNWWIGAPPMYDNDPADGFTLDGTPDGIRVRNSPALILEFLPLGAKNPNPVPGDRVKTDLAELSWTNPDPNEPGGVITPTVYFGTDPNRPQMQSVTLAAGANSVPISDFTDYTPLQDLTTYYWAVDCDDSSGDPLPGLMWKIIVNNNEAPVVDAGADQNKWLGSDPNIVVSLDATVTDDVLPTGATLTYTWTQESGPSSAVINSAATEDTTVRLFDRGTYVFMLTASDSDLETSDTVQIIVGDDACDASHMMSGSADFAQADTNQDCVVNLVDFYNSIAQDWLACTDQLTNCGL